MNFRVVAGCIAILLSHALAAAPTLQAKLEEGIVDFHRADYTGALTTLSPLQEQLKSSGQFNYYHALCLLKANQPQPAIEAMRRAIALNPKNADYHFALALIYSARMSELSLLRAALMLGSAKEALVAAVQLNPQHVRATMALAEFLLDVPSIAGGDPHRAQELLTRLQKLDAGFAAALEAKLELRSGKSDHAVELLLQAVNAEGSDAAFRLRLAKLYLDQRDYSNAIRYGEEYLGMRKHWSAPGSDTNYAHLWLAVAYHAVGNPMKFQFHSRAAGISRMPRRFRQEAERAYKEAGIAEGTNADNN